MNYVGQLAGQVFVTVKELYKGLNPATLSGCIDIIVVRQPDGNLQCSPFHVRFGKMGVLRSREKVVDIEINGESVDLHMKLGDNGEAFFVQEMDNGQPCRETTACWGTRQKQSLCSGSVGTVIVPLGGNSLPPRYIPHSIRGSCSDGITAEEELDRQGEESGIHWILTESSSICVSVKKRRKRRRKSTHKLDSLKREDTSEDEEMFSIQISSEEENEPVDNMRISVTDMFSEEVSEINASAISMLSQSVPYTHSDGEWSPLQSPSSSRPPTPKSDSELVSKSLDRGMQKNNPQMHWAWGELPQAAKSTSLLKAKESSMVNVNPSENTHFRVIQNKRSRHLGADGVYLDDLTDMDPEAAALYFPKNGDNIAHGKNANENGPRSANQSPHSGGSSGVDSGVEGISDGIRDLPSIAISLCGGLSDNKEITKDQFLEQAVTYQKFVDNPAIIDDPNLVVKIGNKYYNWTTAAPLLLAMQAFQKPLPKATVESIMRDKMPKKGGRWWFSWRGRNSTVKEETKPTQDLSGNVLTTEEELSQMSIADRLKDESSSSDEDPRAAKPNIGSLQTNSSHLSLLSGISYKKTLRLTSDQLKSLKLKNGPNDVIFSVTTQYQGTCRCEGTIYLWNWDDKVIISDIDGTITRSDTLGHILPTLGKDWTHQGIAKLYHKVSQNGYKFLYCSARAIGMADMTRGYLHWVNERGTVLPQGPVLLSPSSLFSAFHREVIEKKPEKFKVQCLTDIKHLFHPNTEPFYAAFGNRPADVYSYKQVGVSLNRIFTVNPKGELIQEHAKTNISSDAVRF
ncbi:Phosphatidate phosphatase LPIN1 [Chelonia mydas]|uniref:phosphatidate phosphatase n=1 Tax=Chelonia mydas TaxID=8469 RepID=M7BKG7_CHEMY|nr:Phosphatidate phosphatase LPIN1 [Chelonia mydas]